jgi:hypothetical protein
MSAAAAAAAAAAATAPPVPSNNNNGKGAGAYQARRSNKTTAVQVQSDGAQWKERLAVCEGVSDAGEPNLTIRSYYRNVTTLEKVWDEPPSGASEILFAPPEQRERADLQKQEMQRTLDAIPPESPVLTFPAAAASPLAVKKKGGRFARFKRTPKERPVLTDDSKDLNLQRAIANSVAEQAQAHGVFDKRRRRGDHYEDPVVLYDSEVSRVPGTGDEDDLALAKALSMSVPLQPSGLTDDELLQQALAASRLDEAAVSSPKFDPYAPDDDVAKERKVTPQSNNRKSPPPMEPPHKLTADEGRKKPGRSMKRRVLRSRKGMETKAGLV